MGTPKSRKLKAFLPGWNDKFLKDCECDYSLRCDCSETTPVKKWFTADPTNVQNAKCLACPPTPKMPFGQTFSIVLVIYSAVTVLLAIAAFRRDQMDSSM